jgi:primosomal protein N' (replication factor Y)
MFTIAEVAIKKSGHNSIYSFYVPESLLDVICVGMLVEINFRDSHKFGIIYKLFTAETIDKLKPIEKIIHPDLFLNNEQIKLAEWLSYETCCTIATALFSFLPIMQPPSKKIVIPEELAHVEPPLILNAEQANAIKIISEADKPVLLYGVTGSGKTEVYMEIASAMLKMDKCVLILVPEISLTPQTLSRFKERFGDTVEAWHSQLTSAKRRDIWWRIKNGQTKLIIGSRSALFLPFPNLAFIAIDEEHDNSYYQNSAPRYNAISFAEQYHAHYGAKVVLGSATPSAESVWKVSTDKYNIAKIESRYNQTKLPITTIVDLSQEKLKYNSIISLPLQNSIEHALAEKSQIVLLLNRRGFAPASQCSDCGYICKCPNCDISLTAHYSSRRSVADLICHHCDFSEPTPTLCPNCNTSAIQTKGYGTESVEAELKMLFPTSKILRADKDTTSGRDSIGKIYSSFLAGEYNILIGTQMIAKGWDIPNVSLVGILLAESGLMIPDYNSSSNTFNLLVQTSGRSGRGETVGKTIIQTFQPNNALIRHIAKHDFGSFIKEELTIRKTYNYPPFVKIFRLVFQHDHLTKCQTEPIKVLESLKQLNLVNSEILGPSACFFEKVRGKYRYHLIIKSKSNSDNKILLNYCQMLHSPWSVEIDARDML